MTLEDFAYKIKCVAAEYTSEHVSIECYTSKSGYVGCFSITINGWNFERLIISVLECNEYHIERELVKFQRELDRWKLEQL
jgi:hypothetical protein